PAAAKPAAAAPVATAKETQQAKMKNCNAEAKTKALKGAARKTFMSTCLKGTAAPAAAAH
ncbi:MAG: PsiF family protein, partial [Rudaea sp.]